MRGRAAFLVLFVFVAACTGSTPRAASVDPPTTASTTAATTSSTVRPFVPPERITPASAPPNFGAAAAEWLRVSRRDGAVQVVAVIRPTTRGRHPVVVYLHGSSGLATVQFAWAARLVEAGFVVVVGCYLDASSHTAAWLRCATLPNESRATAAQMQQGYDALLDTAASLPGVTPGDIGVVGVSQGGIVALSDAAPRVKAIVADSAYGSAGVAPITAPVLLLGMTADPNVSHARVLAFERAARAAGKPVESQYYDGVGHVVTLSRTDATARAIGFLRAHL